MDGNRPGDDLPEYNGEAVHTIPGECERLFCDKLSAIFLGERSIARQEPLGMDAFRSIRPNSTDQGHRKIEMWIEVLDYTNDAIYRGFVTGVDDERTLFVFFGEDIIGQSLKSGCVRSLLPSSCSSLVRLVKRRFHHNALSDYPLMLVLQADSPLRACWHTSPWMLSNGCLCPSFGGCS